MILFFLKWFDFDFVMCVIMLFVSGVFSLNGGIYDFVLFMCFFIYGLIERYSVWISILFFFVVGILIFLYLNVFFVGIFFGCFVNKICLFIDIVFFYFFVFCKMC